MRIHQKLLAVLAAAATVAAALTATVGIPFWFAVPLATAFAGLVRTRTAT